MLIMELYYTVAALRARLEKNERSVRELEGLSNTRENTVDSIAADMHSILNGHGQELRASQSAVRQLTDQLSMLHGSVVGNVSRLSTSVEALSEQIARPLKHDPNNEAFGRCEEAVERLRADLAPLVRGASPEGLEIAARFRADVGDLAGKLLELHRGVGV